MVFDEALALMPHAGPRRYRFEKNALVIDFSDRKLLFGLWDRLHGFWSVDANGRQVEEKVALLLYEGFDRSLWSAIGAALHRKNLALHQVEEVKGHYVLRSGSIYFEIDGAYLKANRNFVRLGDAIKVKD